MAVSTSSTHMRSSGRKRRRRRESGLALLLLLVAWELHHLNTEEDGFMAAVADAAPIAAPPDDDAGRSMSGNVTTTSEDGRPRNLTEADRPSSSVWLAAMDSSQQKVDGALESVIKRVDPAHNFTTFRAFVFGFTHYSFDLVKHPGRWIRSFLGYGPFGHCFRLSFPRCTRGFAPGIVTTVHCTIKFFSECNYYDAFFHFRHPIPWPVLNKDFGYQYPRPVHGPLPNTSSGQGGDGGASSSFGTVGATNSSTLLTD